MRVFLTGSSGRIGSVVERVLKDNGCEVVGFDVKEGDDMLDAAAVEKAMSGCDAVAHLAAVMGKNPDEAVFAGAAAGMWHVLQAAERHGIGRVVAYSSVNAMGIFMGESEPDFLPIDETHPCRPGRAYAMSKFLGEETCRLFTRRSGISTISIPPCGPMSASRVSRSRAQRIPILNGCPTGSMAASFTSRTSPSLRGKPWPAILSATKRC